MDQLLWYMFAGTRGGPNRLRIVELLRERPFNAHQLSDLTGLDYRTVCHHLKVLVQNHVLVAPRPGAYGSLYFLSGLTTAEWSTVESIRSKLRSEPGNDGGRASPSTDPVELPEGEGERR